jgi:hypothetical protein
MDVTRERGNWESWYGMVDTISWGFVMRYLLFDAHELIMNIFATDLARQEITAGRAVAKVQQTGRS